MPCQTREASGGACKAGRSRGSRTSRRLVVQAGRGVAASCCCAPPAAPQPGTAPRAVAHRRPRKRGAAQWWRPCPPGTTASQITGDNNNEPTPTELFARPLAIWACASLRARRHPLPPVRPLAGPPSGRCHRAAPPPPSGVPSPHAQRAGPPAATLPRSPPLRLNVGRLLGPGTGSQVAAGVKTPNDAP